MSGKLGFPNLINFCFTFVVSVSSIFLPLFLLQAGFSGFELGFLISMSTITAVFFTFPSGKATDEIPAGKVLMFGLILITLFFLGLAKVESFIWLAVIFFMGGLGKNITRTSLRSIVFKISGKEHKALKLGEFSLIEGLGMSIGIFIGGVFLLSYSFKNLFVISAIVTAVLALLAFRIKKTHTIHNAIKKYGHDFFRKEVIYLALIMFFFATHWGAEDTSYTPFIKEAFNLSMFWIGVYVAVPIAVLAITAYFMGVRLDKHISTKNALFLGLLISGVAHIGMTYPSLTVSFIFRIIHEIGDAMIGILVLVNIGRLFPKKRVGGDSGLMLMVMVLGNFVGSLIYGPIGYTFGFAYPLIISGIVTLVTLAFAFINRNKLGD